MTGKRGLLFTLAGAAFMLQACSSTPPPQPVAAPAAPPAPDYSGTYSGTVTPTKGCPAPSTASLSVENKQFTLMWNKSTTFSGPVADDGSLSATLPGTPASGVQHHKYRRGGAMPGADLTGKIEGNTFTGQVIRNTCTTPLSLQKST